MMPSHPIIERIIANGTPCLFVSPHLDDAALSAGGLALLLAAHVDVTVATVFTTATDGPQTLSARMFVRRCGAPNATALYDRRRTEDRDALTGRGIGIAHLGFTDALWRTRHDITSPSYRYGHFLPELTHLYPTYRWHVATGHIAAADHVLIRDITASLIQILDTTGAGVVFAPRGIGGHVDHCVTRHAALLAAGDRPLLLWDDLPYALGTRTADCGAAAAADTAAFTLQPDAAAKSSLLATYISQKDGFAIAANATTTERFSLPGIPLKRL